MAKPAASPEPLEVEHRLGPLLPLGRFEWERIIKRCTFKQSSIKLTALTIATYADVRTGDRVFPGNTRLAAATGLSERQVIRSIKSLGAVGLLFQTVNGSSFGRGGKGLASAYRLTAPEVLAEHLESDGDEWDELDQWDMDLIMDQVTPKSPDKPEQVTPVSGDKGEQVTPKSPDSGVPNTGTGDTSDRTGDIRAGTGDTHVTPRPHLSLPHESIPHSSWVTLSDKETALDEPPAHDEEISIPDPEDTPLEERNLAWQEMQLVKLQAEYERNQAAQERKAS
jgi:hypothetical protein